jgi:hypothetical protein
LMRPRSPLIQTGRRATQSLDHLNDRTERRACQERITCAPHHEAPRLRLHEQIHQRRLPDPSLAGDQHETTVTTRLCLYVIKPMSERLKLLRTLEEWVIPYLHDVDSTETNTK